ncbi:MAG TPA: trigger factor [Aestuariivirga sp.]|nr:trigger factor [Aestuariivirga sp.]
MQVTETLSSGLKREFKVVVGAAELSKELDSKLHEMAGRANIKGFRPGKVPVPHLKRMYGKALMAEVVQKTIDDQSKQVLAERNLKPAYQPEVKLPEEEKEVNAIMAGESDFAFSLAFEIIPTFELKDISGVELTRHVVEISDAQVDEALTRLTAQYKAWEPKEGKAAKGDKVTIGFVGRVDGKVFDGGTAEDVPLELGSGQFIPGFEDQLIGAQAGNELTVNVTFPATYGVKELADKPAEFAVKVASVEAPKEGTVDDEFAKKMGFEDLGKLKEMIRGRLSQEYAAMTGMKLKRDVLDALDGLYSFELPQRLVEAEFAGIWKALVDEMQKAGKSFADEGTTEEAAKTEYRAIAERRVRLGLVLGTLGEKEGIQVNEQELQQSLMARARQFPGQEKQVFDHYRKNPSALIELRGPVFEQKVVDFLVSKAKVTEKSVSREQLQAMVQDDDEDHSGHDHDHGDHDHDHSHGDHDHDHAEAKPKKKPAAKKAKKKED